MGINLRNFLLIIFFLNLSLYSYDIKKTIIYNSEYSELSNNYSSWKSNSIQTILKNNDKTIGIKAENIEKYNLDDNNIELSYFTPFLDNFLWQIDLNMAENGVVIPKNWNDPENIDIN